MKGKMTERRRTERTKLGLPLKWQKPQVPKLKVVDGKKECSNCGMILSVDKFRVRQQHGKPYIVARCRKCEMEFNTVQCDKERRRFRNRKESNPDRYKRRYSYWKNWLAERPDYQKKIYHKDIKRARGYGAKYRNANRSSLRARATKRQQVNIKNITPQYAKGLIARGTGLAFKEIPVPLIKLKQLQIICKRSLKLKAHEPRTTA